MQRNVTNTDSVRRNLPSTLTSMGHGRGWLGAIRRGITAATTCTILCLIAHSASAQNSFAPPPANFGNGYIQPQSPQPLSQQPNAGFGGPSARVASNPQRGTAGQTPGLLTGGVQAADPASLDASATELDGSESANAEGASIHLGNIISVIREGGVLMIPIMLCSIVLLVFVFERALYLRRGRVIPRPFVRGVIEQLEQQQLEKDDAIALCDENGSPIADLFSGALKKWGRPAVEVEQAILDSSERVTAGLRKYLRLFNAISNLSPLLGLLGTVLGMIEAFNSIAAADALGRPEMLASGIGAALLTTAAGLCVAIPAYAAYAFFVGRTDQLILEMDSYAQNLVDAISAEALQESSGRGRSRSRRSAA